MTGVGYAAVTSTAEASVAMSSQTQIDQGKQLFQQGCATCHGGQFANVKTKSATHVATTAACETCHTSTTSFA